MKIGHSCGRTRDPDIEETEIKPKPMVEIGGMPMLWHIMMLYAHHRFKNFIELLDIRGKLSRNIWSITDR